MVAFWTMQSNCVTFAAFHKNTGTQPKCVQSCLNDNIIYRLRNFQLVSKHKILCSVVDRKRQASKMHSPSLSLKTVFDGCSSLSHECTSQHLPINEFTDVVVIWRSSVHSTNERNTKSKKQGTKKSKQKSAGQKQKLRCKMCGRLSFRKSCQQAFDCAQLFYRKLLPA